jgi:hypothetical protein
MTNIHFPDLFAQYQSINPGIDSTTVDEIIHPSLGVLTK